MGNGLQWFFSSDGKKNQIYVIFFWRDYYDPMPYDYAVLDGTTTYNYPVYDIPIKVRGPDDETPNRFSQPTS